MRVLAQRKARWKEQVATAAALAKAGVPYAFATDGMERIDGFPAAVRQLIANGLTADLALAGLTKNAAAIAGVERRLGVLEPGKLGHVIAMTGAFGDERARVKYVLVDGQKFEIKPEDRARTKGARPGGGEMASAGSELSDRPRRGPGGPGGRGAAPDGEERTGATTRKTTDDQPDAKTKADVAAAKAAQETPQTSDSQAPPRNRQEARAGRRPCA